MKNLILTTYGGDNFNQVSRRAKEWAIEKNNPVEFDFNGIKCIVSPETNLEWLHRDYSNAFEMEWKEVGPNCKEQYSAEIYAELKSRTAESERKQNERVRLAKIKEDAERKEFEEKIKGIEMEFSNLEYYTTGKNNNTDAYGSCIYEYAEGWAKLMQVEISKGKKVIECAKETSHQLGFFGITGYMYGAAVSILSNCWKYGEELREWHNMEYKYSGKGIVNPALMTISI